MTEDRTASDLMEVEASTEAPVRKKPGPAPKRAHLSWREMDKLAAQIKAALDKAHNATRLAETMRVWTRSARYGGSFAQLDATRQRDVISHYAKVQARNEEARKKGVKR